ncbi:unnamed protein product, partial [Darwinula stevensoni]
MEGFQGCTVRELRILLQQSSHSFIGTRCIKCAYVLALITVRSETEPKVCISFMMPYSTPGASAANGGSAEKSRQQNISQPSSSSPMEPIKQSQDIPGEVLRH